MIYGYLRKSNDEGVSSSFDTQKFKIESYCNIHNLNVDEYFEDVCSGGLLLNQREQGMLLSTKLAKGDSIICSALDRYSRSHYGLVNDVEKYRKNKIKLINCGYELTEEYYVKGDGHPNNKAHILYADCIYNGVENLL